MSIRSDEQNRTIKDLKTQLAEKDREIERLHKRAVKAENELDLSYFLSAMKDSFIESCYVTAVEVGDYATIDKIDKINLEKLDLMNKLKGGR